MANDGEISKAGKRSRGMECVCVFGIFKQIGVGYNGKWLLLARTDFVHPQDANTIPVYSGIGLPIMPAVTPGIAVAGVLLMLAGLPLCLIGIKKTKWVYFTLC